MDIKERIIEEATEMFFDNGIKSVRMDDIACACGISKRTLYENFSDREDLIRQCLWHYFDKHITDASQRQLAAENAIEEFWIMFGHGSRFRSATKVVIKDLIKFYPHIFSDFIKSHHSKMMEGIAKCFRRGQANGLILMNIDTIFVAGIITDYLYGIKKEFEDVDEADMNTNPVMRPRSLQFVIMLFLRGLTTEKGREYIDNNILNGLE